MVATSHLPLPASPENSSMPPSIQDGHGSVANVSRFSAVCHGGVKIDMSAVSLFCANFSDVSNACRTAGLLSNTRLSLLSKKL